MDTLAEDRKTATAAVAFRHLGVDGYHVRGDTRTPIRVIRSDSSELAPGLPVSGKAEARIMFTLQTADLPSGPDPVRRGDTIEVAGVNYSVDDIPDRAGEHTARADLRVLVRGP